MNEIAITIVLPQALVERLPENEAERAAYIMQAITHELDGREKAAAAVLGSIKTEKKARASAENGKMSKGPLNPRGGRPKGSKNKPK